MKQPLLTSSDTLPKEPRFPFELNQRVMHATYGAGTIRGVLHSGKSLRWLVQFDAVVTATLPQLYATPTETLQAIATTHE